MFTPSRETVRGRIFRANEYRRNAGNVASRRAYEDVNQWWTVGVDAGFSFGANYVAAGAGYGPPQVLLDPIGVVHVRGVIESVPGWAGGGVMIVFPTGWGPEATYRMPVRLQVVTGAAAGNISSYYVYADDLDRIDSPGTAGFPVIGGNVGNFRVDLGHMTWRRRAP